MSYVTKIQKQHRARKVACRERLRRRITKSWKLKPSHRCGGYGSRCKWVSKKDRRGGKNWKVRS